MLDGMTNIKASEVLKEIKYYTEDLPPYSPDEVAEALEMAIKALEQQPCEDCISREHAKQFLYYEIEHLHDDSLYDCFARIIDDMYNELPSVKPTYTDEEIDKAQAVEQAYVDKMVELAVEEARQKVKPSDSVNRAAVKLDMLKYGFSSPNITITEFVDNLPPVYPERPRGKWIKEKDCLLVYRCSNCKKFVYSRESESDEKFEELSRLDSYKYCPRCGAEMTGGGKDAD